MIAAGVQSASFIGWFLCIFERNGPSVDMAPFAAFRSVLTVNVRRTLNTADEQGCDVIVLGTHGKGWLSREFLGSVARSVIERARKPADSSLPAKYEKNGYD